MRCVQGSPQKDKAGPSFISGRRLPSRPTHFYIPCPLFTPHWSSKAVAVGRVFAHFTRLGSPICQPSDFRFISQLRSLVSRYLTTKTRHESAGRHRNRGKNATSSRPLAASFWPTYKSRQHPAYLETWRTDGTTFSSIRQREVSRREAALRRAALAWALAFLVRTLARQHFSA